MRARGDGAGFIGGDTRVVTRVVACVVACLVAVVSTRTAAADAKNAFSLPFAMRPWSPPNLLRIDSAVLRDREQTTAVPTLTAGARVTANVGVLARVAFVSNAPDDGPNRSGIANPALVLLYAPEIAPHTRAPLAAIVALPLGEGGGDAPDDTPRRALSTGVYARQAMDGALFAPNYLTTGVGGGLSRVAHGFTFQLEVTLFELFRTRGAAVDAEPTRTNLTSGVNVGHAVADFLNLNVEAHYQRWLSTPSVVQKDAAFRDQLTFGGGVRFTVVTAEGAVLRPAIGYFVGVDAPMHRARTHVVQLDLPILF